MAKFSLLTSLTLSAAGFNKGISQATKGAKALSDGVKTAGNTMVNALSPLTSQLGGLGGEFTSMAVGAISAFKKMIPAINSVRAAFMATGIGAIIVVITTAIAALVGWMKRTDEGADGMRRAFEIIKSVINVVLTKITLLGSAIVKLFKRDFKGAAEDAKNALSGWGDAIRDGVEAGKGVDDIKEKIENFELTVATKRADLEEEINQMRLDANDDDNKSAEERLKATQRLKAAQTELYELNNTGAQLNLDLMNAQYETVAHNKDKLKEINEAEAQITTTHAEYLASLKKTNELLEKNNKSVKEELDYKKQIVSMVESLTGLKPIEVSIKPKIDTSGIKLEGLQGPPPKFITPDSEVITSATLFENTWKEATDSVYEMLSNTAIGSQELFMALSKIIMDSLKTLSETLSEGAESFKEFGKEALNSIRKVIGGLISQGIATAITAALSNPAIKIAPWLIPVFAGLAAGLARTAFNSLIPKFHTGGVVGGVGSEVPAVLQRGEMVLTRNQQNNLFDMINKGGNNPGVVLVKFQNGALEGYLQHNQRSVNSYR